MNNTFLDKSLLEAAAKALYGEKKQLNEKLEPHEEQIVDQWDTDRPTHVHNKISEVFGTDSRIEIPFKTHEEVPHPDVEEHLNNHGYQVTDYVSGKAKDKFNREVNIGKALTKTNAEPQIKAAYDNDPVRQQRKTDMKIVISHHPYDVAGMTSGHQSWVEQSCMNFKSGSNRHYLPNELKQGTHVAYLTDKDDHDLERPVARIALKPFYNYNRHLIFRPESKTYGNASSSFHKQVFDWAEKHYHAEQDTQYEKHDDVYNDTDRVYSALGKDTAMEMIKRGLRINGNVSPEVTNHIAGTLLKEQENDPTAHILNHYANNRHNNIAFTRNQANALYSSAVKHGQTEMTNMIAKNHGDVLNKKNLEHAISSYNVSDAVLKHRYLPQSYIDDMTPRDYSLLHPANVKEHHIDKVVDHVIHYGASDYNIRKFNDRLSEDHLKKLSDHYIDKNTPPSLIADRVLSAKNANQNVIDHVYSRAKTMDDKNKRFTMLGLLCKHNKNPNAEFIANAPGSIGHMNHILSNAKDKLTHSLALHKAIRMSKEGYDESIDLGENSAQHIGHKEVEDIYDNIKHFYVSGMHEKIHKKLLDHAAKKIDESYDHYKDVRDQYDPDNAPETVSAWDKASDDVKAKLKTSNDLVRGKLKEYGYAISDGTPFDKEHLDHIENHLNNINNHDLNDEYEFANSHEEANHSLDFTKKQMSRMYQ